MSAFSSERSAIFRKNSTFTQSNNVRAVFRDFSVLLSVFVKLKVTINENISFTDCVQNTAFGLPQIDHKSEK